MPLCTECPVRALLAVVKKTHQCFSSWEKYFNDLTENVNKRERELRDREDVERAYDDALALLKTLSRRFVGLREAADRNAEEAILLLHECEDLAPGLLAADGAAGARAMRLESGQRHDYDGNRPRALDRVVTVGLDKAGHIVAGVSFAGLAPMRAKLLLALAADGAPDAQGLVPWKSYHDIGVALDGPDAPRRGEGSIRELIFHLRDELAVRGLSRSFIETSKGFARLRVRSWEAPAVTAASDNAADTSLNVWLGLNLALAGPVTIPADQPLLSGCSTIVNRSPQS